VTIGSVQQVRPHPKTAYRDTADGVLIKDNHLAAIGDPDRIASAVRHARSR